MSLPLKKNGEQRKKAVYPDVVCRGCGEKFRSLSSRHWLCRNCAEDRSLQARVYRYGYPGVSIKNFFEERGGLCILCDNIAKCVDHDHTTGKIRGVLCHGCNQALGRLDVKGWLEAALKYIERGRDEVTANTR